MRSPLVISSETRWRGSVAKRTSRFVRMPTSLPALPLPPPSTTGTPEIRFSFIKSSACWSVAVGSMVSGRSEEHTSELQSHRDLHSFPTRRSSDLFAVAAAFHHRHAGNPVLLHQVERLLERGGGFDGER